MVLADYNDENYDYTKYWHGREYENESEFIALKKLLPRDFIKDRSVIDIGGGFGRLLPLLKERFGDIAIFDYSQKLLDTARKRAEEFDISIDTTRGDVNFISELVKHKYDFVIMIRVSHHLSDLEKVFVEIEKVLSENGVFILEIANKIHFKAVLLNFLKGNFGYFRRDSISVATKRVTFLNHHPKNIESILDKTGFKIVKKLSVSNLRSPFLKKVLPTDFMILAESLLQNILAPFYFGPSIFYKIVKK